MAVYREIMFSGSAGAFSSVTIDNPLAVNKGGILGDKAIYNALSDGDLMAGNDQGRLERIAIGTSQQVLKVADTSPLSLVWAADAAANIDSINSANSNTIGVNDAGGGSFTITMESASVSNGGNALVTGDHLYDFVAFNPLAKTNVNGSLTAISASSTATSYGVGLESVDKNGSLGNITTDQGTIQLNGAFANIPNTAIGNGTSDARFQIGNSSNSGGILPLGNTRLDVNSLTGISVPSGNRTLFDGVGANELTIADATSEVRFPGNLEVKGTASFVDASTLRIADDVFVVADSNPAAASRGGFIVQQSLSSNNNVAFLFDNTKVSGTPQSGTFKGQFGFPAKHYLGALEAAPTIVERMQVIKVSTSDPDNTGEYPDTPLYGGTEGYGHMWVNRSNSKAYIYV